MTAPAQGDPTLGAAPAVPTGSRRAGLARFVRFGGVGVVNTATYYGTYLAVHLVAPYLVAHAAGVVVSVVGSYFLNCRFTFHVRPSLRTFLLFPLSSVTNVVVTTLGLPFAVEVLGIDDRVAPVLVQLTALPVTYVVAHTVMRGRSGMAASPS
ncbi:GtrA family protein [Kineosporia sp. R_H_3]|uniref:GtrA family protein n=1 Tax=Kineosporia sp. R_H_3 TaxID=1961848 RepID=UPI000B4AB120|nr:GtrA family protein [Kineosporia sp. R_H_3]